MKDILDEAKGCSDLLIDFKVAYEEFYVSKAFYSVYVEGGEKTLEELENAPYLELHYFSDFQMDEWTGDFGGEIRLGIYFDGEKEIYVTGGSISGNIKDVDMYLSKDMQTKDNYICPKAIKLLGVTIAS